MHQIPRFIRFVLLAVGLTLLWRRWLLGLPIFCLPLLVHFFRGSSRTLTKRSQSKGTLSKASQPREPPKLQLPVILVRLSEHRQQHDALKSPRNPFDKVTGSTSRWNNVTIFWKVVMILNSACWGSTFIATKAGIDALETAGVPNPGAVFGICRFALAAFPLLPWLGRSTSLESALMSFLVGIIWGTSYASTFLSYTLGTTGAKAAFITSLQSLVVAACTSLVAGRLQIGTIVSALLAVLGVAFIELNGSLDPTIGDAVCITAPICVGLGWYVLDRTMKKYPKDFMPSVVIQFSVFTLICAAWLLKDRHGFQQILEIPQLLRTPNLLWPLLFASIFGNLVTMLSANVACRHLPVSDVSLIVTTEPLFAALAAACCLGETFSLGDYLGGFFIMAALICNELWGSQEENDEKLEPPSGSSSPSTCYVSMCETGHSVSSASIGRV